MRQEGFWTVAWFVFKHLFGRHDWMPHRSSTAAYAWRVCRECGKTERV